MACKSKFKLRHTLRVSILHLGPGRSNLEMAERSQALSGNPTLRCKGLDSLLFPLTTLRRFPIYDKLIEDGPVHSSLMESVKALRVGGVISFVGRE